jgi:hypothetical protein
MGRLKTLNFSSGDELEDFYEDNRLEIYTRTIDILEKTFKQNKSPTTVDIYKLNIPSQPNMKYISIMEDEWGLSFDEIIGYAEEVENYDLAVRVRDLNILIFGKY